MGVLYVIVAICAAGVVEELIAALAGNGKVGDYDYHFAPGVGAVFGTYGE